MAAAVLLRNFYLRVLAIHSNLQIWVQATERHNDVLYSIIVVQTQYWKLLLLAKIAHHDPLQTAFLAWKWEKFEYDASLKHLKFNKTLALYRQSYGKFKNPRKLQVDPKIVSPILD